MLQISWMNHQVSSAIVSESLSSIGLDHSSSSSVSIVYQSDTSAANNPREINQHFARFFCKFTVCTILAVPAIFKYSAGIDKRAIVEETNWHYSFSLLDFRINHHHHRPTHEHTSPANHLTAENIRYPPLLLGSVGSNRSRYCLDLASERCHGGIVPSIMGLRLVQLRLWRIAFRMVVLPSAGRRRMRSIRMLW